MSLVSVIIPTYNRVKFLKDAIDSVLAQDYNDFELIVVNDGSTDSTPELLKSYGKRIKVIHQKNKGVSAARNSGIAESCGEFTAFLDSDDLWLSEKLSVQSIFFKKHPNALICQTEEIWIRNGTRVNPKKRHKKQSGMIFDQSLPLCIVSPSAVMMRRSLFDMVGFFDTKLPACEDYDLWLRVSCRFPIYLIDRPLIIKRGGHADQLSNASRLDRFRIQALIKILKSNLLSPEQEEKTLKILKYKSNIYYKGCLKHGRLKEAEYYNLIKKLAKDKIMV
ncbi:Glycosyl transferase [Candidatus Magnetomoraceae bacterium gMMP-13]